MHRSTASEIACPVRAPVLASERERGVRAVVGLTAAMMVLEIAAGYWTGSLALLADGWHMATHVAALGLAALAYAVARRFAGHRAFAFGTGKVHALAGYSSAVALGLVALGMLIEAVSRLLHPSVVDYRASLPVAVLGLIVNLASIRLLHAHEGHEHEGHEHEGHEHEGHEHEGHGHEGHGHEGHGHEGHGHEGHGHESHGHEGHGHEPPGGTRARLTHEPAPAPGPLARTGHGADHNHRAALLHVVADALTSVLAIIALLAGQLAGYTWLDPAMGIVGGLVIVKWAAGLCKHAAFELLDVDPSPALEEDIRAALERSDDVRVSDLHVWSLGRGARGCVVTIVSGAPRESAHYRALLEPFGLLHLTVEVRRCQGHT